MLVWEPGYLACCWRTMIVYTLDWWTGEPAVAAGANDSVHTRLLAYGARIPCLLLLAHYDSVPTRLVVALGTSIPCLLFQVKKLC